LKGEYFFRYFDKRFSLRLSWSDFAFFTGPMHSQIFEETLRWKIPYKIYGASPFMKGEIKDILHISGWS
jgi:hypothetical protein